MKRVFCLIMTVLLISGCMHRASFSPAGKNLTDAVQNQPYYTRIDITGGVAIHTSFTSQFNWRDYGLDVVNCDYPAEWNVRGKDKNANCVEVKGTPVRTGVIDLTISGTTYGDMFFSGKDFEKTYTLTIHPKP